MHFLGLPDGVLEYGVALRRVIAREVRRHRPDVVLTNNFRPTWDGATILNQADHMVTGQATLDAVRDAANRWVFTDLADEGLEPWSGVRQVWAAGSPDSKHAVDVTDTYDKGMESLRAHDAYLRGLGDFDPTEFLESFMRSGRGPSRRPLRLTVRGLPGRLSHGADLLADPVEPFGDESTE